MAVYAVGDIQGCYRELRRLLDVLRFDPSTDRLWLTGDLVNRGPQSLETLRFVRGLGTAAVSVLGNHDLHLLAAATHAEKLKPQDTLDEILNAPDRDELLDWLRRLPLLHHDAQLGYTLIHAGLPPQWDLASAAACAHEVEAQLRSDRYADFFAHMYGNEPTQWSDGLRGWDRLRFITNCLTRLRYCGTDGRIALAHKGAPGTQPPGLLPWFEIRDRRSRDLKLVFGHWSTLGDRSDPGIYALDSGCVWGGKLTALRLDGDPVWTRLPCPGARVPGEE